MIKLNEKTDKELFLAKMNFFVHNNINFMISRDLVYTTNVSDSIEVTFRLNDNTIDSPYVLMSIKDDEEKTNLDYKLNLCDSIVDVLQTIVDLITNRVRSLDDNPLLSSDWKMLLYKMIG